MTALAALRDALVGRPRDAALVGGVGLAYAGLYLWVIGDLGPGGGGGLAARFPAWERVWQARGPLYFEPVGLIEAGPWIWTFSPLNTLLGLVLGWRLRHGTRHCPWRAPGGPLLAALPALLAGGACCAPMVLIWLGLPLAGVLIPVLPWLLPLAALLLLASLGMLARRLAASTS
ncbi:hypothetical protein [Halomonas saccharevitans]|uniref:Uncharacterized protein n=1 Tax=Halomonas saccharevitans TaxID=416872 RepID=A0A1I6XMG3_9GAMM|nr:hypothetical protein [Halomonas saccharevitans]SFT39555.1 hypothetical protein SAMN04487956_10314 [Halomonas saccharevitans]